MKPNPPPKQHAGAHQLRIIAGQWRSRRLPILALEGLRPTPDRVRETLFNWLQFPVRGARCLDLFAGSGALGLEALSRGASELVLVEKHPKAAATLQTNINTLKALNAEVYHQEALSYLDQATIPFDIIFLDPPFHHNWLPMVLERIQDKQLLAPQGYIYLEYERELELDLSQWNLTIHKQLHAGQVHCVLAQLSSA
ncbi:MAG: 16S rRNA (guanine(966)-N(2))-methyltransferase RsmD [Thiofilum sp.]|uniref:16S rRNA (guanine(966)-N(2))-methyltransferase RsmD n=1 Tax=Thiofilum sp. TaxID=2212733 RepID=UPI0025E420DF|nr:16S rRNA (guanine(966)-N(2))-methyltransferase RsmD [Thiofilum sp.]MBK8451738.1 16S rRNA (guanine(966)-N(2))-methyltransferase RsmD [Thiofilum sp.]